MICVVKPLAYNIVFSMAFGKESSILKQDHMMYRRTYHVLHWLLQIIKHCTLHGCCISFNREY